MTVHLEAGEYPVVNIGDRVQYKNGKTINGRIENIDFHEGVLSYFIRKSNNQLDYGPVMSLRRIRKKNRKKYPKSQKHNRNLHIDDPLIVKN